MRKVKLTNSLVIRQKGNLKTGVSRKQRTSKFPKNKHFLPPDAPFALLPTNSNKVDDYERAINNDLKLV